MALIEDRRRMVLLYSCGCFVPSVVQRLEEEKVAVSKRPYTRMPVQVIPVQYI